MHETDLREELSSLRRRHEAAVARAGEADQVIAALTALLAADAPDRIGQTIFDSFRALAAFDRGFILTFDEDGGLHCRFATHPPGALSGAADAFARVASGQAAAIPDARRAKALAPFLPAGDGPVSGLMFPFSARSGRRGLVLFLCEGFGVYSREQAGRLKRFAIVASLGLSALDEIRLTRDFDRAERAREVERAANQAKSRFLEQISHELRTPLNGVLGSVQVLKLRGLPEEAMASLGDIETCGQDMLRLVTDIIDYAAAEDRIDHGDVAALDALLVDVVQEHAPRASAAGLSLNTEIDPRLEDWRITGAASVRRILSILVDNGVKYTGAGGVRVDCRSMGADGLEISVADTGAGLSPEEVELAFEPFKRGDDSPTRHVDGIGIGLPLARRLVRELGGAITLQTVEGAGTNVRVELPASVMLRPEPGPAAPQALKKQA